MSLKQKKYADYLSGAREENLFRELKGIKPLSAREAVWNDKTLLNFSSNNYLALANHPKLIERSVEWTERYGTGATASRLVCGTYKPYLKLEEEIAEWKKCESALLFGSGYMANLGVISSLTARKSAIFADKLNHASLNTGSILSGAKFKRYRHNDLKHLERISTEFADYDTCLLVSDTVFSMDGDFADIDELANFAENQKMLLYLDDAHGSGVFGEKGKGLADGSFCDICMGTFSKAMGSYGAYVACSQTLKEYFINTCGSFIYTTALPPGVCGAISAAVELVQTEEFRKVRNELSEKSKYLRNGLQSLGFDTGKSQSPVIPVILGENDKVLQCSKQLLDNGILAVAIRPPTVPRGTARIRLSVNASHSYDDLNKLLDIFERVFNENQ